MGLMRKTVLFFLVFILILGSTEAFACSMRNPDLRLIEEDENLKGYCVLDSIRQVYAMDSYNESTILERCPDFSLSEDDTKHIMILWNDMVNDDSNRQSYQYISRQNDQEYLDFLSKAKRTNNNICDCSEYIIFGRSGEWTGYESSFKSSCSLSTACYQPPFFCPNNQLFIVVLPFYIIGIVGLVILFRRLKKKKYE